MVKTTNVKPRRYRKARKYVTARKMVRKAKKANFVRAVKKVISAQVESKMAHITSGNNLISFNSGINSSADMLQVLPNIAQGTGDSNRIGDQIRGQSLTIKGHVRLQPNTETNELLSTTNVVVRMMVLSMKNRNGIYADAIGGSANLSNLLKKGSTTSGFTGVLGDINAEINTDWFTLHAERKFYLNQSLIAVPGPAGQSSVAMDTRNLVKFFKIKIPCKKLLKYDAGAASGLQPLNWAPFLVLGYSFLNGASPDTVSTNVGMSYITDFKYEDA